MTRLLDETLAFLPFCNRLGSKRGTIRTNRLPAGMRVLESSYTAHLVTSLYSLDPFDIIPRTCNCIIVYVRLVPLGSHVGRTLGRYPFHHKGRTRSPGVCARKKAATRRSKQHQTVNVFVQCGLRRFPHEVFRWVGFLSTL